MSKKSVTAKDVHHISQLAQIPITEKESKELAKAFVETFNVIDQLQSLNVSQTDITYQVTGLENNWREDAVDKKVMFSQKEALQNAKKTHQGYFVVPKILEAKDT